MDPSHDTDARLGALLDEYQRLKEAEPAASTERLRDQAGDLYADFVDLAGCLDLVQDESSVVAPPAASPPATPSRSRWIVPIVVVTTLAAGAGIWFASRPQPSRLDVTVYPKADVLVDGIAYDGGLLAPGPHELVVEREGFARYVQTIELGGQDLAHAVHLVPRDPFDISYTRPLAKAYGVIVGRATAPLQRPVGIQSTVDSSAALRVRHPEALTMELSRFPTAVRGRDDVRLLAARRLFRAGLFAESYAVAREIAERYPQHRQPWFHCARALAGLGLVETERYAEVLARFDEASARK